MSEKKSGKDLVVKDLGSTNGTFIGGDKITSAILMPGQRLLLGDVELRFETRAKVPMQARLGRLKARVVRLLTWLKTWGVARISSVRERVTIEKMKKNPRLAAAVIAPILAVIAATALAFHFLDPPGQVGRWKFIETSGTAAKDSSGGHDGKLMNAPKWTRGIKNGAVRFSGSRPQCVYLGNILQGSYTGITIACWVRHPRSGWQTIVERSIWNQSDGIGLCMDNNGGSVDFGHNGLGYVRSKTNVQDDRWHHVVGTMSKSGSGYIYSIYVDGKLDNSISSAVGLTATSGAWTIGARYNGAWPYQGLIGDVRIFNRALSPSQVGKLFNQ